MNNKPEGLSVADINELKAKLKAAAEKATPGKWRRASTRFNGITATPYFLGGEEVILAGTSEKRDAEFIAAANPDNILALIKALEKREELRAAANRVATQQDIEICELRQRIAELEAQLAELAAQEPVGAPDAWLWKKKTGYLTAGINRPMYEPLHSAAIALYACATPPAPADDTYLNSVVRADALNELCIAFVKHANNAGLADDENISLRECTDALQHCRDKLLETYAAAGIKLQIEGE